jgi:putative phage-type endonuclease
MTYTQLLSATEARPDNPRWHELRRAGVTASEIAAVMGISPWNSPFSLYWQKANGWSEPENPEMAAGRRAEPVIADWYLEVADPLGALKMERAGLYASVERPWQIATPDRLIYSQCDECDGTGHCRIKRYGYQQTACEDCIGTGMTGPVLAPLECKYVIGSWDGWGPSGSDIIPVHYRAQALWQADVMDVDETQVAAWHGAELRVYQIQRDEGDLAIMRAEAELFLDRLAGGEVPPLDGHEATLRTLKALHPNLEDREQEISPEVAAGYAAARRLKTAAAADADLWEARLRAEMGNARRAVCGGKFVASRSIYELGGEDYELHALDGISPVVDKLNPARGAK